MPRVVGAGKSCEGDEAASSLSDSCVSFERLRGYAKKKSNIVCCALASTWWSGSVAHVFTLSPTATCAMSMTRPSASLCRRDTPPCARSTSTLVISDAPAMHMLTRGSAVVVLCIASHLASVSAAVMALLSTRFRIRRGVWVTGGYASIWSGVLPW